MYQRKNPLKAKYPYEFGLHVLGGKWQSRVITELGFHGRLRYSTLKSILQPISDTVLTRTLQVLLEDGFIFKITEQTQDKVQCFYDVTEKGGDLIPIIQAICQWSGRYGHEVNDSMAPECISCPIRQGLVPVSRLGCRTVGKTLNGERAFKINNGQFSSASESSQKLD